MIRFLLFLNCACLAYTLYASSNSWAVNQLIPIILFIASIILLTVRASRIGNWILFISSGFFAIGGTLTMLVALIGGLQSSGLEALAVLVILFPVAVLLGIVVQGKKALDQAT